MDMKERLSDMKESLQQAQEAYTGNKKVYDVKLQELKDDFGFKNLGEAKEALLKMRKKEVVMQKRLDDVVSDFEDKYKDLLNEYNTNQ